MTRRSLVKPPVCLNLEQAKANWVKLVISQVTCLTMVVLVGLHRMDLLLCIISRFYTQLELDLLSRLTHHVMKRTNAGQTAPTLDRSCWHSEPPRRGRFPSCVASRKAAPSQCRLPRLRRLNKVLFKLLLITNLPSTMR